MTVCANPACNRQLTPYKPPKGVDPAVAVGERFCSRKCLEAVLGVGPAARANGAKT